MNLIRDFMNIWKILKRQELDNIYENSFVDKTFENTKGTDKSYKCRFILRIKTETGRGFDSDTYSIYETRDHRIIIHIKHYYFNTKYSSGWFSTYSLIELENMEEFYEFCMNTETTSRLELKRKTYNLFSELGWPDKPIDKLPRQLQGDE